MNTVFRILLVALCLSSVSFASNQSILEIPIHSNVPSGNNPHAPTIVPLSCYVSSAMNELFIVSNVLTETVHVYVENTTTGSYFSEDVAISSFPSPLSLFGTGYYTIEIYLQSGAMYYGSFML